MKILFIGKRFYTNRDALGERYGRIYQIPYHWAESGRPTRLWLIDYHSKVSKCVTDGELTVESTPVLSWRFVRRLAGESCKVFRRARRPDLVIASSDCYIGLLGYVIARMLRAVFVFDLYDRYDVFAGYRRLPGFDPQTYLLRHADAVSFASIAVRDELQHETRQMFVVPNGIDRSHFRPLPMTEARDQFDLPAASTLIGYFGSMEPERGIADLIAAVAKLRADGSEAELVIAGHAHADVKLDQPWVHYLGNLEFSQMPAALASCDVLTLPYRHSPFLDNAASCKIAEYIAAERPIVATRTPNLLRNFPLQASELDDMIAAPGDVADLARCLVHQLDERRLVSMPDNMDWQSISETLIDFLVNEFSFKVDP